jgi:tetratricopeptide (TPR) repeat protein
MRNPHTLYLIPYTLYRLGFLILFFSLAPPFTFAQDVDIVPYLKQVESGNKKEVLEKFTSLKKEFPASPSVMFLEGVLTENGQDAVTIYSKIVNYYPDSKYADAALYRIYSYYFALGLYETAKTHLEKLKRNYPGSPYIKIADRNIPSEDEFSTAQLRDDKIDKKEESTNQQTGKSNYTIQAGAFSKLVNAQSLRDDFKDSGFFSEIKEKVVGGTTFHVVYIGQFISEGEAQNFLQVINKEFRLDGRVVQVQE